MQKVIIEDRTEKERLRIQLEKEQRERDAAIKVKHTCRHISHIPDAEAVEKL